MAYEHTLQDNIKIIRGNSSYADQNVGTVVRKAIAEAIEQEDDYMDAKILEMHEEVLQQDVRMSVTPISGEKYNLTFINTQTNS